MFALVLNPVGLNDVALDRNPFSFNFDIIFSSLGGDDFIFLAISSNVKNIPGISDSSRHL